MSYDERQPHQSIPCTLSLVEAHSS